MGRELPMTRLETPGAFPEGVSWGIRGRFGSLPQSAKMMTMANSSTAIVTHGTDFRSVSALRCGLPSVAIHLEATGGAGAMIRRG